MTIEMKYNAAKCFLEVTQKNDIGRVSGLLDVPPDKIDDLIDQLHHEQWLLRMRGVLKKEHQ